tara:strand:+ start:279 stop:464 length:186 start_codon:yes stop_codon:yes gene_type:complete
MIDKKLLDVLVCPKSKKKLILIGQELFCIESKLAYPINDGIPILLVKEARELTSEEISNIN